MLLNAAGARTGAPEIIDRAAARKETGDFVVYFAHSLIEYDTERARRARAVVRAWADGQAVERGTAAGILDPSEWGRQDVVAAFGSYEAFYRRAVTACCVVVALEHRKHIGRGVYEELHVALRERMPAYVVRGDVIAPVRNVRVVDRRDWKIRYARIVTAEERP